MIYCDTCNKQIDTDFDVEHEDLHNDPGYFEADVYEDEETISNLR
jgi:hypothetical protein